MQHTVRSDVTLTGVGVHSGVETHLTVSPAASGTGIVFVRSDVTDRDNRIPATYDRVRDTRLCTVIANDAGVSVGTIEHLLAALAACAIDNVEITLDGPEVPILDGSSALFITAIESVGRTTQAAPRRVLRILKDVTVQDGNAIVTLKPSMGMKFRADIEFPHQLIGAQGYELDLMEGRFAQDVAAARTFGFYHEVAYLRQQGLALGGSLENAIVLDQQAGTILNPEGLRFKDEFARHKLLDAVGDLYLAGGAILGAYHGTKAGHAINNRVLHALFERTDAYAWVDLYVDTTTGLREVDMVPAAMPVPEMIPVAAMAHA
ncbi:MAG: UDP-3-O-acyl-N-acetylglucosamine deacetylase [Pseudomonadota bacterium]